jgi:hypothetical protein
MSGPVSEAPPEVLIAEALLASMLNSCNAMIGPDGRIRNKGRFKEFTDKLYDNGGPPMAAELLAFFAQGVLACLKTMKDMDEIKNMSIN